VFWQGDGYRAALGVGALRNVRRVTDSEGDSDEYRRCPERYALSGGSIDGPDSWPRRGVSNQLDGSAAELMSLGGFRSNRVGSSMTGRPRTDFKCGDVLKANVAYGPLTMADGVGCGALTRRSLETMEHDICQSSTSLTRVFALASNECFSITS
jgi:hypothetical protein